MAVTINGTTFSSLYLQKQPLAYEESDAVLGRTARKWTIEGLMTPSDWLTLIDIYDDFRDAKITEESPVKTNSLGTVVTLSATGPGGLVWTGVQCWFRTAPATESLGSFVQVSFQLIDATQGLELLQADLDSEENDLKPDLGTITIGTTVVKLTQPANTFQEGPTLQLTASGSHYLSGSLSVYKIKNVVGETNAQGYADICSWYEQQIVAVPLPGSYYPIAPPQFGAERRIVNNAATDIYTVSISLGLVL